MDSLLFVARLDALSTRIAHRRLAVKAPERH
jgi:hypothetical protein